MVASVYLVHHGRAGFLGRFRAVDERPFGRGEVVVVHGRRGPELGEVLCAGGPLSLDLDDPFVGELLRTATTADLAVADQRRDLCRNLIDAAQLLAAERSLPVTVLDGEVALDGQTAVLHTLRFGPGDDGELAAQLGDRFGLVVRVYDVSQEPVAPPPAPDAEEKLDCGKENCGGGQCDSCGTEGGGGGGGCTSCSAGSARDLAAYFGELREKMEQRNRVPLV